MTNKTKATKTVEEILWIIRARYVPEDLQDLWTIVTIGPESSAVYKQYADSHEAHITAFNLELAGETYQLLSPERIANKRKPKDEK